MSRHEQSGQFFESGHRAVNHDLRTKLLQRFAAQRRPFIDLDNIPSLSDEEINHRHASLQ